MQPVPFRTLPDGTVSLDLSVDGRWARLVAGYRHRPDRVSLRVLTRTVKRGGAVSCRLEISDDRGTRVKGGVLLEVDVFGPAGERLPRHSGMHAPLPGTLTAQSRMEENSMAGSYRVVASLPQTGARADAQFVLE